jgi:hypothetical protein
MDSDPPGLPQDEAKFAGHICSQIQFLVSQLHRGGSHQPAFIQSQLWELTEGVMHIAEQYACDHLSGPLLLDTNGADEIEITNNSLLPAGNNGLLSAADPPASWPEFSPLIPDTTYTTYAPTEVMPPPSSSMIDYPRPDRASPSSEEVQQEQCGIGSIVIQPADEHVPTPEGENAGNDLAIQEGCDHGQTEDRYLLSEPAIQSSNDSAQSAPGSKSEPTGQENCSIRIPTKSKGSTCSLKADGCTSRSRKRRKVPGSADRARELTTELAPIAKKILEPDEICRILTERAEPKYHEKEVPFLVLLFFAIASPPAFKQLAETCATARQPHDLEIPNSTNDNTTLMRALDALESGTTIRVILRRFFLVRLWDQRLQLQDYYNRRKSARIAAQRSSRTPVDDADVSGRADSIALRKLLTMFYPHLKEPSEGDPAADKGEYGEKYRKLKNRLSSARNWHALQQRFSPGILALVPCGEFQIGADKFVTAVNIACRLSC